MSRSPNRLMLLNSATVLEVRTIIQLAEQFASKVADIARAEDEEQLADEASKLESLCFASAAELQQECADWVKRFDENG